MTPAIQENVLGKLRLSIGEASRVSGISVRQLSYWTNKGLVRALGAPGRKRYDFRALERIALIKRYLNEGFALEEAAREAALLVRQRAVRPSNAQEVIAERLAELEELVTYLKQRLVQGTNPSQLATTARKLSQLNLAALWDEPRKRRSLRTQAD